MKQFIKYNWQTMLFILAFAIPLISAGSMILSIPTNLDSPMLAAHKYCASQNISPENIYCADFWGNRMYQQCTLTYKEQDNQTKHLDLICPRVGSSSMGCTRFTNDSR